MQSAGNELQRLFPHSRLSEREAAERSTAIEAHRRELGSRLGRNVGAVVAAVDYMLNISGDLVAPTIVELRRAPPRFQATRHS